MRVEKQPILFDPIAGKTHSIAYAHSTVPQQQNQCLHTLGIFRTAIGKLIFVFVDGRQYAKHLFMREWQCRAKGDFWRSQIAGRILGYPFALLAKTKKRAQPFQFLAA
ncbi:MAG: hypothetical protein WA639_13705 [Candidatus Acidiferrum sp.]